MAWLDVSRFCIVATSYGLSLIGWILARRIVSWIFDYIYPVTPPQSQGLADVVVAFYLLHGVDDVRTMNE